ncbi:MAG: hypothetical protein AAFY26_18460 [Cyanobacteria bacterium J06638_22]
MLEKNTGFESTLDLLRRAIALAKLWQHKLWTNIQVCDRSKHPCCTAAILSMALLVYKMPLRLSLSKPVHPSTGSGRTANFSK